jgi:hypothetical protein
MDGGLENRCAGRVCGADGAVRRRQFNQAFTVPSLFHTCLRYYPPRFSKKFS